MQCCFINYIYNLYTISFICKFSIITIMFANLIKFYINNNPEILDKNDNLF